MKAGRLYDTFVERLAANLAVEKRLLDAGWYKLSTIMIAFGLSEISEWLEKNCQSEYVMLPNRILFSNRGDSLLFELTWL